MLYYIFYMWHNYSILRRFSPHRQNTRIDWKASIFIIIIIIIIIIINISILSETYLNDASCVEISLNRGGLFLCHVDTDPFSIA